MAKKRRSYSNDTQPNNDPILRSHAIIQYWGTELSPNSLSVLSMQMLQELEKATDKLSSRILAQIDDFFTEQIDEEIDRRLRERDNRSGQLDGWRLVQDDMVGLSVTHISRQSPLYMRIALHVDRERILEMGPIGERFLIEVAPLLLQTVIRNMSRGKAVYSVYQALRRDLRRNGEAGARGAVLLFIAVQLGANTAGQGTFTERIDLSKPLPAELLQEPEY